MFTVCDMDTEQASSPLLLLTRAEAAKVLKVTVKTLERWERAGKLTPLRNGKTIRYRVEDIEAAFGGVDGAA